LSEDIRKYIWEIKKIKNMHLNIAARIDRRIKELEDTLGDEEE